MKEISNKLWEKSEACYRVTFKNRDGTKVAVYYTPCKKNGILDNIEYWKDFYQKFLKINQEEDDTWIEYSIYEIKRVPYRSFYYGFRYRDPVIITRENCKIIRFDERQKFLYRGALVICITEEENYAVKMCCSYSKIIQLENTNNFAMLLINEEDEDYRCMDSFKSWSLEERILINRDNYKNLEWNKKAIYQYRGVKLVLINGWVGGFCVILLDLPDKHFIKDENLKYKDEFFLKEDCEDSHIRILEDLMEYIDKNYQIIEPYII